LVWTRAAEDWERDAPVLAAALPREVEIVRVPCIAVQAKAATLPAGGPWDFVAVTSRNAVRFAAVVPGFLEAARAARRIYTHGTETAKDLAALGLVPSVAPVRTAAGLCAWLLAEVPPPATFLIPAAEEPAFDLAQGLAALGHRAEALICYGTTATPRNVDGAPLTARECQALAARLAGVVCFASPSAVRGFAPLVAANGRRLASTLVVAAIGPATAKAASGGFRRVESAAKSTVAALAELAAGLLSEE
jgi:uroporphyrinogen-III synthase